MFKVLHKLVTAWNQDRISSQSAALAYYSLFSLAPILLICISVVGVVFGAEAAQGKILTQIRGLIGTEAALQIQNLISAANKPITAFWAKLFSIFILIFTASGIFSEIQFGLNLIWGVKANPNAKWYQFIQNRLFSFFMVLCAALILLAFLIMSALFAMFSVYVNEFIGSYMILDLIINDISAFLLGTFLFALMFKVLPDVKIKWRDVWVGALVTSILFNLGKMLIGLYLQQIHTASVFGAASSLIVILIWIYYSAQIFFIGAEITNILFIRKGKKIIPARNAIFLTKI